MHDLSVISTLAAGLAAALVLGGLLGLSVSRTRSDPVVEIKAVA